MQRVEYRLSITFNGVEMDRTNFYKTAIQSLNTLQQQCPFGLWMFTKAMPAEDEWIALVTHDSSYGVSDGDVFRWSDSFCSRMVNQEGPRLVPDVKDVPAYLDAPISGNFNIASYVGMPLQTSDGSLFGTLCGIDKHTKKPEQLEQNSVLFETVALLLMRVYEQEIELVEIRRAYEKLSLISQTDYLTGIMNLRGWKTMLQSEETRSRRYGTPCAIAIVDMNNLKIVNDRHGHDVGDRMIIKLANILEKSVRETDIIARIGGDEFGIFIYKSKPAETDKLIQRIHEDLAANDISAAVGYSQFSAGKDFQRMLTEADQNMYSVKRSMKQNN